MELFLRVFDEDLQHLCDQFEHFWEGVFPKVVDAHCRRVVESVAFRHPIWILYPHLCHLCDHR